MPITTLNITKPFAENGDRNQIPAYAANELVSYDAGWTEAYSRLASDLFFNREDINGVLYSLSVACIINDENMQFVRQEAQDERAKLKKTIDDSTAATEGKLGAYLSQIELNKDNIQDNKDDIQDLDTRLIELEQKMVNGDFDDNQLDPIKQSIIFLQDQVEQLEECCDEGKADLENKINKTEVYTKNESDDLFALKADVTSAFIFKGSVDTYSTLGLILSPEAGWVYYVEEVEEVDGKEYPNGFYAYVGGDAAAGTAGHFVQFSQGLLTIDDSNYAKLDRSNTFAATNKIANPNAQEDNDVITLGEANTLISNSEQNIQVSIEVNTQAISELRGNLIDEIAEREDADEKLGLKIEQNRIDIQLAKADITDLDNRVTDLEINGGGGGGGTIDPDTLTNFAKLNQENTFAKENTFNLGIQIPTAPKDDDSATNKAYVDEQDQKLLETINGILQDYARISDILEVDYFDDLPTADIAIGTIYKVVIGNTQDKAGFYIYTHNGWEFVGSEPSEIESAGFARLDTENTFAEVNTFEADVVLEGGNPKTDNSAVNKKYLDSRLNNLTQDISDTYAKLAGDNEFTGENTFSTTPKVTSQIQDSTDVATKGYVDNAILNAGAGTPTIDLSDYAKLTEANEWTAENTFSGQVVLDYEPTSLTSAVNRGWVETAIEEAKQDIQIPDIDTSDLASLSKDNSFTGTNLFTLTKSETFDFVSNNGKTLLTANSENIEVDTPLLIKTPKTENEKDDIAENEVVTKGQLSFLVSGGGGGNVDLSEVIATSDSSPIEGKPAGYLWIKTSYKQDPDNNVIFNDKPALFISLGNNKWWDLHKEELHEV